MPMISHKMTKRMCTKCSDGRRKMKEENRESKGMNVCIKYKKEEKDILGDPHAKRGTLDPLRVILCRRKADCD